MISKTYFLISIRDIQNTFQVMKISENYIDILHILDICRYLFLDISNFGIDILYIFRYLIYSQISHVYNLSDACNLAYGPA